MEPALAPRALDHWPLVQSVWLSTDAVQLLIAGTESTQEAKRGHFGRHSYTLRVVPLCTLGALCHRTFVVVTSLAHTKAGCRAISSLICADGALKDVLSSSGSRINADTIRMKPVAAIETLQHPITRRGRLLAEAVQFASFWVAAAAKERSEMPGLLLRDFDVPDLVIFRALATIYFDRWSLLLWLWLWCRWFDRRLRIVLFALVAFVASTRAATRREEPDAAEMEPIFAAHALNHPVPVTTVEDWLLADAIQVSLALTVENYFGRSDRVPRKVALLELRSLGRPGCHEE